MNQIHFPGHRDPPLAQDRLLHVLRRTTVQMVAGDDPDLTQRQMAVLLTVYLEDGPHTVRGMAAQMNVAKPAITRALDRLGELDLTRRKVDPMDRRSVLVQRTLKGAAFLRRLRGLMVAAEIHADGPLPAEAEGVSS
jgi:DNA-binding MarR family transcriptional regulator